jgi:hypothetical protein
MKKYIRFTNLVGVAVMILDLPYFPAHKTHFFSRKM